MDNIENNKNLTINLNKSELISLYRLLCQTKKLDIPLVSLQIKLEKVVFPLYTIDELEKMHEEAEVGNVI